MSQAPTPYERQKNFVSDATNNPSITVPQIATGLDAEFVAVESSLNDTINRLSELQRDDGALRDAIVSTQSLSPTVLALIGLNGVVARGAWVTATAYAAGDVVGNGGGTYLAVSAHTANADFSVDQVAGLWLTLEAPFNNSITVQRYTANGSQVAFSLGGSGVVNATNVFINGVYQNKDTYSINTNVLTFGEAPPSGAIVEIIVGSISPVTAVVPDLSISTAKIADGAITTAKIANGAVITADLADGAVTSAKIADGVVTPGKLSTGGPTWDTSGIVTAMGGLNPIIQALPNDANGIGSFSSFAKNALNAIVGQLQMYCSTGAAVLNSAYNLPMLFLTNNAERMRISADGNVGIGTSSPTAKLDVVGNDSTGNGVVVKVVNNNASASSSSQLLAVNGNGVSVQLQTYNNFALVNCTSNHNLELRTNNQPRLVITNTGGTDTQGNPITNCPTTAKAWAWVTGLVNTNGAAQAFTGYNVASIIRGATAGLYTITLTSGTFTGSVVLASVAGTNNSGGRIFSYSGNTCVVQMYVGVTSTDFGFNMVYFSN